MTELADAYCRHTLLTALQAPTRDAPADLVAIWYEVVPPLMADYCTVLEAIGPVHSVWSARTVEGAWKRLDEAANQRT